MKCVLDTTAYSELLRGNEKVADVLKKAAEILIPQVVIAELRYGFCLGSKQAENEKLLRRFIANRKIRILLTNNVTTDYFVDIALFARKKGMQLSSHDIWIAALTEQWNATLVTFDQDFTYLDYKNLKLWPK